MLPHIQLNASFGVPCVPAAAIEVPTEGAATPDRTSAGRAAAIGS